MLLAKHEKRQQSWPAPSASLFVGNQKCFLLAKGHSLNPLSCQPECLTPYLEDRHTVFAANNSKEPDALCSHVFRQRLSFNSNMHSSILSPQIMKFCASDPIAPQPSSGFRILMQLCSQGQHPQNKWIVGLRRQTSGKE